MTPLPIDDEREPTGGGAPNLPACEVLGASQSPASPFSRSVSLVAETLAEAAGDLPADAFECPVDWSGAPTPAALRKLLAEHRTPAFDVDRAAEVLTSLWEGNTLKRTCEMTGLSRGTVMAWAALVPKFGELLEKAQTGLGQWFRDCAAEDADAALMGARLRLAASYDRRLRAAGAEGDAECGGSLVVQVVKLG
jgi:hypothetical protein